MIRYVIELILFLATILGFTVVYADRKNGDKQ